MARRIHSDDLIKELAKQNICRTCDVWAVLHMLGRFRKNPTTGNARNELSHLDVEARALAERMFKDMGIDVSADDNTDPCN